MTKFVSVFGMSAEEVAKTLTCIFGSTVKLDIIKILIKELGISRVAKLGKTYVPTLANALRRGRIGDKLAFKIFAGAAEEYPETLKVAVEAVMEKYREELQGTVFEKFFSDLIEKKKKSLAETK